MAEPSLRPADDQQAERLHTFAHDIKNRLGGLWEAFRMLHEGPPEGLDGKEVQAFAERSFFTAQRDIEDLLDAFDVDRGVRADKASFDLITTLNTALGNEQYRLRKKDQRVDVHGPEHALVLGDARWTERVLQALLSNASKFSQRSSVIVAEVCMEHGHCAVRVTDKGSGLPAEDLREVFTRYAILTSHSTDGEPQARGTLARARQWAEAQGGTLIASSPGTGAGSTFTLTLPA